MSKQIINIGTAPNSKNGDSIRDAFKKVNDNFNELYSATGADVQIPSQTDQDGNFLTTDGTALSWTPINHIGDDVQFVDVDVNSGTVVIQSGFDTGMPVYIKGANCSDEGTGGDVYIEAGGAPLPNSGTTGVVGIAGREITIETEGGTTTFATGPQGAPYVNFPDWDGQIGIQGVELGGTQGLVLTAFDRSLYLSTNPSSPNRMWWEFDKVGTLTVPHLFPTSFTAILDTEHMSYPDPAVALAGIGDLWQFNVQFQVAPDGQIETMLDQIFPIQSNPGYVSGYAFTFTELDHGIPGYTFTIQLDDVVYPGGAGWTANPAVTPAPYYPPTIASDGAIKLSANENSWVFGTDGILNLPVGGDIQIAGQTVLGGSGSSLTFFDTNNANYWLNITELQLGDNLSITGVGDEGSGIIRLDATGGGNGFSVSDFGDGFGTDNAGKIVTNKLYSTNQTNSNQHYRLELDTNGVVHLPDQSIINGATLRCVPGTGELNYAALAAGPDTNNPEKTWIWADANGAWVATDSYNSYHTWHFDNSGNLNLPTGGIIKDSTGHDIRDISQLKFDSGKRITMTGNGSGLVFWTNFNNGAAAGSIYANSTDGFGLSDATGNGVSIKGYGDNKWTFGDDGRLHLAGGLYSRQVPQVGNYVNGIPYDNIGSGDPQHYVFYGINSAVQIAESYGDITGYTLAQDGGEFTTTITGMDESIGGFITADPLPAYEPGITFNLSSPDFAPSTINDITLNTGDQGSTATWTFNADGNVILPTNGKVLGDNVTVKGSSSVALKVTSATNPLATKDWSFDGTGKVWFPDGTIQTTAYQKVSPPLSSKGLASHKAGMVAFSADAFFYCTTDYTDGSNDIWVKSVWTHTGTW